MVALAVSGLAMIPLWALVLRPYLTAGAPLGLSHLPPWMWVQVVLFVPGIILGWLGLR